MHASATCRPDPASGCDSRHVAYPWHVGPVDQGTPYNLLVVRRPATNVDFSDRKTDPRGWLFELTKSKAFGQVFVSSTLPGVTRGNHYHDSKIEKFCLVQGDAIIRLRKLDSGEVIEYPVNDREIRITDIPPGYTHSIENVGATPMIVLFWANEIFDPDRPDTHMEFVLK